MAREARGVAGYLLPAVMSVRKLQLCGAPASRPASSSRHSAVTEDPFSDYLGNRAAWYDLVLGGALGVVGAGELVALAGTCDAALRGNQDAVSRSWRGRWSCWGSVVRLAYGVCNSFDNFVARGRRQRREYCSQVVKLAQQLRTGRRIVAACRNRTRASARRSRGRGQGLKV